ncbi:MAG: Mur ligase family protein [Bacteroidota bacterium]|nr:Mur ligase family protein [Bacteroidota bacterium]
MRVHFISIGGSIMHNLAIELQNNGFEVSGSDDEFFEPSKSRLQENGLLPNKKGWNTNLITKEIDIVVLGMHAKSDNPELKKAIELGLKIQSFPELIYQNTKEKTRVAIAGSHGKTTITSMVMHVLAKTSKDFDYLVGAKLKGFENSVKLTTTAPNIILEADEYLSSAIDKRPKFLWYKPQITLISGIAWDHMNVFPTFENYKKQFIDYIESLPLNAVLIYYKGDKLLNKIVNQFKNFKKIPYDFPDYKAENGKFKLETKNGFLELNMFGSHNLLNLEGARLVCEQLGVNNDKFYKSIGDFQGAGKRLEVIYKSDDLTIFKDFAHSPSKVKATIKGIKEQYPERKIIACLELHTFSSLNKDFIPEYKNTTNDADEIFVFINEEAVNLKRLELMSADEIQKAFNNPNIEVFFDINKLDKRIGKLNKNNSIILLMSSGDFKKWDLIPN